MEISDLDESDSAQKDSSLGIAMRGDDHINELITWAHYGTDQMSALAEGMPDEMWVDEHMFIAEMRD